MADEIAQRERVIEVARTWLGTKFHDGAGLKGVGVDCAFFLARVYEEAGVIPHQEIKPYSPQWMLHGDAPLFEEHVLRYAHRIGSQKGDVVEGMAPKMGDAVLYKVGRMFAHGAIVIDWPSKIIHAFKVFGFVAETGADESDLIRRERRFYSMW